VAKLPRGKTVSDISERFTELLKFDVLVVVSVDVAPYLLDFLASTTVLVRREVA